MTLRDKSNRAILRWMNRKWFGGYPEAVGELGKIFRLFALGLDSALKHAPT